MNEKKENNPPRLGKKKIRNRFEEGEKASTVCCYFLLPIKVNSIIKASLTNAAQLCQWICANVNRWFECFINIAANGTYFNWMFVFTCLWNETDGRAKHLHGFSTQQGDDIFERENAVGKMLFLLIGTQAAEIRMQLRVAPFQFLEGSSLFDFPSSSSAVQLHLLPLKVLRGLHLPGVHC